MDAAIALYASAAVLLVIAGAVKVVRPATTADLIEDLLGDLRLAGSVPLEGQQLAIGLGVVEIVLGIAALVLEVPAVAVVVGGLYVLFTLNVLRAMRLGTESCGCFGRVDAPPSWFHVIGNVALAVASFVAASGRSPLEVMDGQAAGGIGFVVFIGVLAGVEFVMFTALPAAVEARKARPSRS